MNSQDLTYIRELVRNRSGIVLDADKEYLVQSRLDPVSKEGGFENLESLIQSLRTSPNGGLHKRVIEAMTTNETSFFRDVLPFNALKTQVLPDLIKLRNGIRSLNIWCGASSSGQEPYTLMMILRETFPDLNSWTLKFVATDISTEMLDRCREGRYSQLEVNRGLPANLLMKYFQQKGMGWQVKEELRRAIDFREMNLTGPWPKLPPMDLIFVRNVLIYFDVATKKQILEKVRQTMSPDGYLFLGGAESTLNLDDAFHRVDLGGTSCYRLHT